MFSLSSQDNSRQGNADSGSSRQNTEEWIHNTIKDSSVEAGFMRGNEQSSELSVENASHSEEHENREEDHSEDDSSGASVPDWDLLVAGYRACAEEAIRFLVEDENLPTSHPLVTGLWQHLSHRQAILDVADILGNADEPRSSADDSAIELSVNLSVEETSIPSTECGNSRELTS